MHHDLVVVGWYGNPMEARLALVLLEANGLPAIILSDDAGGMLPSLQLLAETRVAVRATDADSARSLLESTSTVPPGDTPPLSA